MSIFSFLKPSKKKAVSEFHDFQISYFDQKGNLHHETVSAKDETEILIKYGTSLTKLKQIS